MHILYKILLIIAVVSPPAGCDDSSKGVVSNKDDAEIHSHAITLIRPSGGETVTDTFTVIWNTSYPEGGGTELLEVDLDYRLEESFIWNPLDSNLADTGSYLWDTSSLLEENSYRLRITVSHPSGLTASDSSGNAFTVAEAVFITDRTGRKWDITHAVVRYNLEKGNFNYGLGPDAIQPVNSPDFLSPQDNGYPADDSGERVIGIEIEGDARAYPITPLSRHEVVNDYVGQSHVAVTY